MKTTNNRRRSFARSKVQITKARALRHSQTESEESAWHLLRKLRDRGFRFRRQHPIGQFIVDFCCASRRLIVELDGSVHAQPSQARRDALRDAHLRRMGYTVARIPNGMVSEVPRLFVEKVLHIASSLPGTAEPSRDV